MKVFNVYIGHVILILDMQIFHSIACYSCYCSDLCKENIFAIEEDALVVIGFSFYFLALAFWVITLHFTSF